MFELDPSRGSITARDMWGAGYTWPAADSAGNELEDVAGYTTQAGLVVSFRRRLDTGDTAQVLGDLDLNTSGVYVQDRVIRDAVVSCAWACGPEPSLEYHAFANRGAFVFNLVAGSGGLSQRPRCC